MTTENDGNEFILYADIAEYFPAIELWTGGAKTRNDSANGESDGGVAVDTSDRPPKPAAERVRLGWPDRTISVGSGFYNPGVTCYINSALQALFHIPAFVNWLANDEQHQRACRRKSDLRPFCVVCMVYDTFVLSQRHTGSGCNASPVTDGLYLICEHLSTRRQEDAHEFLRYLVDGMERSYSLGAADPSAERTATPVNQIFGGLLRSAVTCNACGRASSTFQRFEDLNLDISTSDSVGDALAKYFRTEPVDASYACENCRTTGNSTRQYFVERPPNVLCAQLNRYSVGADGSSVRKNVKPIVVDERLDVTDYRFGRREIGADSRPVTYRLASMVMHHGTSVNSGHYTAVGLTPSGSYYHFDDSKVCKIDFEHCSRHNDSYVLFYELEPADGANNANVQCRTVAATDSTPKREPLEPSDVAESEHDNHKVSKKRHRSTVVSEIDCQRPTLRSNCSAARCRPFVSNKRDDSEFDTYMVSKKRRLNSAISETGGKMPGFRFVRNGRTISRNTSTKCLPLKSSDVAKRNEKFQNICSAVRCKPSVSNKRDDGKFQYL